MSATMTFAVSFERSGRPQARPMTSPGRTPRVTRLLALAHSIDAKICAGEIENLAARRLGLTRARITQVMNLLLLAPPIQEKILATLPMNAGRDPITERMLRAVVAEVEWNLQRPVGRLSAPTRRLDRGAIRPSLVVVPPASLLFALELLRIVGLSLRSLLLFVAYRIDPRISDTSRRCLVCHPDLHDESVPYLSPTTLTQDEQRVILRVTAANPRDHLIYSLALGTGLRLAEIVGLNVGDVFTLDGTPKVRLRVRAEIAKGHRAADVFLPDRLVAKLRRFWKDKHARREGRAASDPLFCNQSRQRISRRRVQFAWRTWQKKAGFDRFYGLHSLRHTAVSNVYRATHDLFLAQRFARHVSPLTTTVYTHPSDEEMREKVRRLSC